MFISFFRSNQPFALVAIPCLLAIIWIPSFLGHDAVYTGQAMPLFVKASTFLKTWPVLAGILSILLISVQSIHLNTLVRKHEIIPGRSYLPALFFVLMNVMVPGQLLFHPVLLINSLLLFILDRSLMMYRNPSGISLLFDTGMLISLATFIYFPSIILLLFLWSSCMMFRSFAWREWAAGIIGFFLPYFFLFIYYLWTTTNPFTLLLSRITGSLTSNPIPFSFFSRSEWLVISMVLILFLLSLSKLSRSFYKQVIKTRMYQQTIIMLLIIVAFSWLLPWPFKVFHLSLSAIPLAIFISYFFQMTGRKWLREAIFLIFIIGLVITHWLA